MIEHLLILGDLLDLFTSPSRLIAVLIEGLAKASLYVMIASGLTLIFGLMDVINFAHGALRCTAPTWPAG